MEKLRSIFLSSLLLFAGVFAGSPALAAAELKPGRYIGWIQFTDRGEKIAVVAEFFQESPEDFTKFPKMNASFKLSLGGYNTHEYMTENFKDLKYDFDNGKLTIGEDKNDLVMTTEITKSGGRTKVAGQVFVRSSATFGTVEVLEESDEPEDTVLSVRSVNAKEASKFIPLLDGQYEGKCDGKEAAIQILTMRGLKTNKQGGNEGSYGLERDYGISGRLAYKTDALCGNLSTNEWCTRYTFGGGAYNIYLGKLVFRGSQSTEECTLKDGNLKCRIRTFDKTISCSLKKTPSANERATFFPRRFQVNATQEQMANLPEPEPPANSALSFALNGKFSGFIHNETNDQYIPVSLHVLPFSSTENPHNPNQMMVSVSSSMSPGKFNRDQFVTQRFDSRSFYLRPGFVLAGPDADTFISIVEWKQGYIRGTWFSHAFGRVGSVQLVKGTTATLPEAAKVAPSFAGEFERSLTAKLTQWFRFIFPSQPTDLQGHLIRFNGSSQVLVGNTPIREIEAGMFDPYTGRLGWIISKDNVEVFGTGRIDVDGNAELFVPPLPIFGVKANQYKFESYKRLKE